MFDEKKLAQLDPVYFNIITLDDRDRLLDNYISGLQSAGIKSYEIKANKTDDRTFEGVRIATMHRVRIVYMFDFINYTEDMLETDIENELVRNVTSLLMELGKRLYREPLMIKCLMRGFFLPIFFISIHNSFLNLIPKTFWTGYFTVTEMVHNERTHLRMGGVNSYFYVCFKIVSVM